MIRNRQSIYLSMPLAKKATTQASSGDKRLLRGMAMGIACLLIHTSGIITKRSAREIVKVFNCSYVKLKQMLDAALEMGILVDEGDVWRVATSFKDSCGGNFSLRLPNCWGDREKKLKVKFGFIEDAIRSVAALYVMRAKTYAFNGEISPTDSRVYERPKKREKVNKTCKSRVRKSKSLLRKIEEPQEAERQAYLRSLTPLQRRTLQKARDAKRNRGGQERGFSMAYLCDVMNCCEPKCRRLLGRLVDRMELVRKVVTPAKKLDGFPVGDEAYGVYLSRVDNNYYLVIPNEYWTTEKLEERVKVLVR